MSQSIELHHSTKPGFPDVSIIVTRGKNSYLRIVGTHPDFQIMTATASENDGSFVVCSDKIRLISSALRFGSELGTNPSSAKDSSGREYIQICSFHFNAASPGADEESQLYGALERFFEIFDSYFSAEPKEKNDLRDIYDAIATDDSGDFMYLGDGVWLGGDGSLEDRGR